MRNICNGIDDIITSQEEIWSNVIVYHYLNQQSVVHLRKKWYD